MGKEKSKITVRDVHSGQVLFECGMDESHKAYAFAAEMEQMGLDLEIVSPTLAETLSNSLGLTEAQKQDYKDSLEEEIEQHDGSCCFEDPSDETIH